MNRKKTPLEPKLSQTSNIGRKEQSQKWNMIESDLPGLVKLLSDNPNPVFRLSPEGHVLYANPAAESFMEVWNIVSGDKVPENILHLISNATDSNNTKKIEIRCCDRIYTFYVVRVADGNYINLYGSESSGLLNTKDLIRQSQITFSELVELAPFGIYVIDSKFCIAHMNAGSQVGAFKNVRPLIGRPFNEAMHILWSDSVAEEIIAKFRHTLNTGEAYYSPRFTNPRHDIEIVESYEWELHRITLPDGQYGVICYYFDSTKLRNVEKDLRESEEKYRNIVETAGEGIVIAKPDGPFIYVNQKWCEMLGYTSEEMLGKSALDFMYFKSAGKNVLQNRQQLKSGETVSGEFSYRRKNGEILVTSFNATALFDSFRNHIANLVMHSDITERKNMEEALKKSHETYMELVTNARSMIFRLDTNGVFTFVNEFALDFFGYTEKEILGKTPTDTITPHIESTGRNLDLMVEKIYLDPDKFEVNVNENIKKNGERVWVEWHNKALFDNAGTRTGHIAIGVDVTKRIKAEASLKESEERFKALAEASPVGMGVVGDPDGNFLYVNPSYERYFGYDKDELLGKHSVDIFWDSRDRDFVLKKMKEENHVSNYEVKLKRKDGSSFWSASSIRKIRFVDKPAHLGTFIDITGRKEAEEKLSQAQKKLNMALDKGNIGIWEWNLKTNEISWDEKLEKMFGLEPGTFGKNLKAFEKLVNEEDLAHIQIAIKNAIEKDIPLDTVFRTISKDKKIKYISSKGLINKDKDGTPVSMLGVSFDVTGLKEDTENVISKLNEELLRSNKELESFAYVASHDLQEPLRMVSSFTQLLEQQYKDKLDDKALDYIHFAVDGSKRMYDLLNGLLAYSRIHTKGKEFRKVELTDVLETANKNLALTIKESNAIIKSDELPSVNGDEIQLTQLFQNLISNSIKFSTKTPKIYISATSNPDHYLFSVKDKGIGIESQYFEKIFQIFQRLHPKEQYNGTGIGLAICKRIVERHGGSIWVESVYGKGSTFFFTIPKQNYLS